MDLHLFSKGLLILDSSGKAILRRALPEGAVSPHKLDSRPLSTLLRRGGIPVRRVERIFLYEEYLWFGERLHFTGNQGVREQIAQGYRSFHGEENEEGVVRTAYLTGSEFVFGVAVSGKVVDALHGVFPRAFIYSGSLTWGDYWTRAALKRHAPGYSYVALLALYGSALLLYGIPGNLRTVLRPSFLTGLAPTSGEISLDTEREAVGNALRETIAEVQMAFGGNYPLQEGVFAIFPETADALKALGQEVVEILTHLPREEVYPRELLLAEPSVYVRRDWKPYLPVLAGALAYAGAFGTTAYLRSVESSLSAQLEAQRVEYARYKAEEESVKKLETELASFEETAGKLEASRRGGLTQTLASLGEVLGDRYRVRLLRYAPPGGYTVEVVGLGQNANLKDLLERLGALGKVKLAAVNYDPRPDEGAFVATFLLEGKL